MIRNIAGSKIKTSVACTPVSYNITLCGNRPGVTTEAYFVLILHRIHGLTQIIDTLHVLAESVYVGRCSRISIGSMRVVAINALYMFSCHKWVFNRVVYTGVG